MMNLLILSLDFNLQTFCTWQSQTKVDQSKQEEEEIDIDLNDPEVEKAATKIQAGFRGHKTRKEMQSKTEVQVGIRKIYTLVPEMTWNCSCVKTHADCGVLPFIFCFLTNDQLQINIINAVNNIKHPTLYSLQ